jgi:N-methylhydantoinase A
MQALFLEMEQAGQVMLTAAGIAEPQRALARSADCRYVRQAYELTVPLEAGPITSNALARLASTFHARHRQVYGHDNPREAVQIVTLRLTATGHLPAISLAAETTDPGQPLPARPVWFPLGGEVMCPVRTRGQLRQEGSMAGPVIIEEVDTTVVVPPGWTATVDAHGFIILTRISV